MPAKKKAAAKKKAPATAQAPSAPPTEGDMEDRALAMVSSPESAIVAHTSGMAAVSGDISVDDMQIPWIGLVAGNSELATKGFRPGRFVYDGSYELPEEAEVIFLTMNVYQRETVDKDERGMELITPRRWDTIAQAKAAMRELNPETGELPLGYKAAALFRILIRVPDDAEDIAEAAWLSSDMGDFLVAQWSCKNTSYKATGGVIAFELQSALKGDLSSRTFKLLSQWNEYNGNRWLTPLLRSGRKVTDETRNKIAEVTGIEIPGAS